MRQSLDEVEALFCFINIFTTPPTGEYVYEYVCENKEKIDPLTA